MNAADSATAIDAELRRQREADRAHMDVLMDFCDLGTRNWGGHELHKITMSDRAAVVAAYRADPTNEAAAAAVVALAVAMKLVPASEARNV